MLDSDIRWKSSEPCLSHKEYPGQCGNTLASAHFGLQDATYREYSEQLSQNIYIGENIFIANEASTPHLLEWKTQASFEPNLSMVFKHFQGIHSRQV